MISMGIEKTETVDEASWVNLTPGDNWSGATDRQRRACDVEADISARTAI